MADVRTTARMGRVVGGLLLASVVVAYTVWAARFIVLSSFVAVDDKRYYSLFDDAMIAMRYAWNLAHGEGPVWNPGEPVEGYTSPLMVAMMAIPSAFLDKTTAVLAVQMAGIAIGWGIGGLSVGVYRMARSSNPAQANLIPVAVVFLGSIAYYPLGYFTLMGMETGLLTLLLMAEVYLALRYAGTGTARGAAWVGVAGGLAYLARPDSVVFSVPILTYVWFVGRGRGLRLRGSEHALVAAGVLAGTILLHRAWALAYYGSILPNTYSLKVSGIPLAVRLVNGARFVYRYLIQVWPVVLVGLAEALFDARREKLLLATLIAAGLGYQVWVGGDPWPYWRMMASTWPLLAVLAASLLEAALRTLGESHVSTFLQRKPIVPPGAALAVVASVGLLALVRSANDPFKEEITGAAPIYQVESNLKNVNEAIAILEATTDGASVGSVWAGTIPYYTGLYAVDFLGKSDPFIARLPPDLSGAVSWGGMSSVPGHNKYDLTYSIGTRRPTYTQVLRWGSQDLSALLESTYVEVYVRFPGRETIPLFLLRDSPHVVWSRVFIP